MPQTQEKWYWDKLKGTDVLKGSQFPTVYFLISITLVWRSCPASRS